MSIHRGLAHSLGIGSARVGFIQVKEILALHCGSPSSQRSFHLEEFASPGSFMERESCHVTGYPQSSRLPGTCWIVNIILMSCMKGQSFYLRRVLVISGNTSIHFLLPDW